jgi:hypothetical protein
MELPTDTQTSLRVGYALGERLSRVASWIIENITHATKQIDDQPSVVIKSMLEYSREQHRQDQPRDELGRAYKELRAAYLKYAEVALREAQARERRLLYGITGLGEHPVDTRPLEDYELQPSRPKPKPRKENSV